jgi:hypothetical protein
MEKTDPIIEISQVLARLTSYLILEAFSAINSKNREVDEHER